MNLYDIVTTLTVEEAKATKTRLDKTCWKGKKIGKPATKVKGGVRVNNCVPKESVEEDSWHDGSNAWSSENHEMVEAQLSVGDPVIVTAPNEFEGKTGEISEFSPSGKFVVVNLYNHGEHSMHLSDVEYNQYADEEDDLNENFNDSPVTGAITRRILMQRHDLLKQYGPELVGAAVDNVADYVGDVDEIGSSDVSAWVAQVERMLKENPPEAFAEGYQDFNKVEPYAVCLAGKPVKQFDYYEQARKFHDNWKQKLYREGNKAKADTITLMPLNLDEGDDLGNLDAEVFGRIDKEKQRQADLKKNDPAAYAKEMEKDSKNYGRGIMGALRRKYDQPLDEAMNKNDLLGNVAKDLNTQFKKAKSGKLKASGDFTKGDHWQGAKPGDYGYTGYQGHGMPVDKKKVNEFAPGNGKDPFDSDPRSQTVNKVQQLLDAGKSVFVLLPGAKGRAIGTQIGDDHSWLNVQYKGWKDPKTRSSSRLTVNLKADDDASLKLTPGSQFTDSKDRPFDYTLSGEAKTSGRGLWEQGVAESDSGDYDYPYTMSARDKGRYDAMTGREYNNPYSAFGTQEDHNNAIEYSAAYDSANEQGVAEGTGPQSKLDQKIIHLLTNGIPADAIARKLDIPVAWVDEVAEYNMPNSAIDYNDPRNTPPTNRFGEGQTDYSKRRQRERDVDAGKPVAKQRQSKMTDYQKKRAQDKKDMELGEMDKSQKGAPGWNINDNDAGGKESTGTPVTAKDAVKDMNKELNRAFDRNAKPQPTGVKKKNEFDIKESYWTRLQNERNTKIAGLVGELTESIKDVK